MPEHFAQLIRKYEDAIILAWVEEVYADSRTELPAMLSYGQLVNHMPELLAELARVLDGADSEGEIIEGAKRLRAHAQVRFYQGALVDEVAQELMLFRKVFSEFLWREGMSVTGRDLWRLRNALRLASRFLDEVIVQSLIVFAASLRPPVQTRTSIWPPMRRRELRPQGSD
jgi:hypothetical protein